MDSQRTQLDTLTDLAPYRGQHVEEFGGIFVGVMPVERSTDHFALIIPDAPEARLANFTWGPREAIDGADHNWDGFANTEALSRAGSELALQIFLLNIALQLDLYLPARNELRLIELIRPDILTGNWFWSSTQRSAQEAWAQFPDDGNQAAVDKDGRLSVQLVRRVQIIGW